jgi:hypothetical protein
MLKILIPLMFISLNLFADTTIDCVDMGGGRLNCTSRNSGLKVYQATPNNAYGDSINSGINGFIQGQQIRAQRANIALMEQQISQNNQTQENPNNEVKENPCDSKNLRYTEFNMYKSKNDPSKMTHIIGDDCTGEIVAFDFPNGEINRKIIEDSFEDHRRR